MAALPKLTQIILLIPISEILKNFQETIQCRMLQPSILQRKASIMFVLLGTIHIALEAVARSYSVKQVLLKTLQNSQENICVRVSFLIKLQT